MANWTTLKTAIANVIKTNGNQEITGQLLQNVLNNIVSSVGANATFAGIATPTTNPGTLDGPVFYLATEAGTYANFSGISVADGEAAILEWKDGWTKKTTGFATTDSCIINCILKQEKVPENSVGSDGDYMMLDSNNRIYKKINGTWQKQKISLSNIYRYGNDCYIKESTEDSSPFVRLDYLSQKNIGDNWYINTFYNLFRANDNLPFNTREEARKYWKENIKTKYDYYTSLSHGATIYYELSDGSKILEQFIGNTGSAYYFLDSSWVYILGGPVEDMQSDFLDCNAESRNFIKNKILKWDKGNILSFGNTSITPNGEWMYDAHYASASHVIMSKGITVTDDNMYLSLMPTIYSGVDTDIVKLQVYNSTKKEYVYDKKIHIKTFAQSYPIAVKVEKDNTYVIFIGKMACTTQYYVSNPVLYSVSAKPALILFENDIDKDISGIKDNIVKINGKLKIITEQELIYKDENKYINTITTFGICPVSPGDILTIFIQTEYSDLANFRLYALGAPQITLLYESGNKDLSQGLRFEYIVPNDYEYSAITFRTGVVGTIVLLSVNKLAIKQNGNVSTSDWNGKTYSSYGDSVTAINNGDFEAPFIINTNSNWGVMVAKYLEFQKSIGRGIGGQRFSWGSNGGSVCFADSMGVVNTRNDSYNYDNYEGNIEIPEGTTPIRGSSCSWLRITTQYPESIKDNIDVVTIMYHNDYSISYNPDSEEVVFMKNNSTDPEWASSPYYAAYGGDYNISTVKGGIASTIMKFQAWMPNAIIVLCTPISGRPDFNLSGDEIDPTLQSKMINVARAVKEVANLMSIPCIDVYGTDGINGLNRNLYISDIIHPYKLAGRKMVARAIIGGLKGIIPNIYPEIN